MFYRVLNIYAILLFILSQHVSIYVAIVIYTVCVRFVFVLLHHQVVNNYLWVEWIWKI